jgi:hypothetical protein
VQAYIVGSKSDCKLITRLENDKLYIRCTINTITVGLRNFIKQVCVHAHAYALSSKLRLSLLSYSRARLDTNFPDKIVAFAVIQAVMPAMPYD